jgi:hypothetical protein
MYIVAYEICFSAANRVLTDKIIKLDEKIFQALILFKNWNDAESKLHDKSWMYSIDWEEITATLRFDTSEKIQKMN